MNYRVAITLVPPLLLQPRIYVKTHLLLTAYTENELVGIDCVTSNPNNGITACRVVSVAVPFKGNKAPKMYLGYKRKTE